MRSLLSTNSVPQAQAVHSLTSKRRGMSHDGNGCAAKAGDAHGMRFLLAVVGCGIRARCDRERVAAFKRARSLLACEIAATGFGCCVRTRLRIFVYLRSERP